MKLLEDLYVYPWLDIRHNNANSYLLGGEVLTLIDPGHLRFVPDLASRMQRDGFSPGDLSLIISTHLHPDHHEGVEAFHGALVAFHRAEGEILDEYASLLYQGGGFKVPSKGPHLFLKEGELFLGAEAWQVLHTPGHSPGSICLYSPQRRVLITGDVVFAGGVGRTDLMGDPQALARSIRRLQSLDVEYLLPGHGEILIGREAIRENFLWIERTVLPYLL